MSAAVLEQLPRFSEYDPGAVGEGSLDPLGFGAVADRIADLLAPGVRARMSQPRFVTLSAIGAHACQRIRSVDLSDDKPSNDQPSVDIVFEWLVVESLVRYPYPDRLRGVPGSQKAQRAAKMRERLSAQTYLAAPRVFGFTGVYRPFSLDAGILNLDGSPSEKADRLLRAWERGDDKLSGFTDGVPGSPGLSLRREVEKECRAALRATHVNAPRTGWLMEKVASSMAPREAHSDERQVLNELIVNGPHEVRNELTNLLSRLRPDSDVPQQELARTLVAKATPPTKRTLCAAIEFETCATAIENAFRRLLAYATSLGGAFTIAEGRDTPQMEELAPHLPGMIMRATNAAANLDEPLGHQVAECFAHFDHKQSGGEFVHNLIDRHRRVQDTKGKRMWIDPLKQKWVVRPLYRDPHRELDDEAWIHPMRLRTLVAFLEATR